MNGKGKARYRSRSNGMSVDPDASDIKGAGLVEERISVDRDPSSAAAGAIFAVVSRLAGRTAIATGPIRLAFFTLTIGIRRAAAARRKSPDIALAAAAQMSVSKRAGKCGVEPRANSLSSNVFPFRSRAGTE